MIHPDSSSDIKELYEGREGWRGREREREAGCHLKLLSTRIVT